MSVQQFTVPMPRDPGTTTPVSVRPPLRYRAALRRIGRALLIMMSAIGCVMGGVAFDATACAMRAEAEQAGRDRAGVPAG